MKSNLQVRAAAKASRVPLWRVALARGVSEATIIRWLRVPLPADKERRILEAIKELSGEVVQ